MLHCRREGSEFLQLQGMAFPHGASNWQSQILGQLAIPATGSSVGEFRGGGFMPDIPVVDIADDGGGGYFLGQGRFGSVRIRRLLCLSIYYYFFFSLVIAHQLCCKRVFKIAAPHTYTHRRQRRRRL